MHILSELIFGLHIWPTPELVFLGVLVNGCGGAMLSLGEVDAISTSTSSKEPKIPDTSKDSMLAEKGLYMQVIFNILYIS